MSVTEYVKEFEEYRNSICRRISKIPRLKGDERASEINGANKEITLAQETIQALQIAANFGEKNLESRIQEYEEDIRTWKMQLKSAQAEYAIARDELFGDVSIHNHLSTTSDQRTRMEQVTRTTANNSMLIDETKRSLDDSYSTGVDIMNMLSVQDEQIDRNREKVRGMNDRLTRTGKKMRQLGMRLVTNKIILACIALILIGFIGLVIFIFLYGYLAPSDSTTA